MSNVRIANIGGTEAELTAEDKTYLLGEIVVAEKENGRLDMKLCDGKTKYSELSFLFDMIYPVGSIYMSVNNVEPGVLFGGTWVQIEDTFLLAAGSTYVAGTTGGEAEHTLTVNEMPKHNHAQLGAKGEEPNTSPVRQAYQEDGHVVVYDSTGKAIWYNNTFSYAEKIYRSTTINMDGVTGETGNGEAHNNMPPYLAIYMWQRIL